MSLAADPCLEHFLRYLSGERNASVHTLKSYRMDIGQFAAQRWGAETLPAVSVARS